MSDTAYKAYKSTFMSLNYIMKNGKPAIFVNGQFVTNVKLEIDELDHEIAEGHPHISHDEGATQITVEQVDAMAGLRARLREELIAEMKANESVLKDVGSAEPTKLMPGNTMDISQAALGSGPARTIVIKK
jgi:hypothetical protein